MAKFSVVIIRQSGTIETTTQDKFPDLKQLQEIVGGPIEQVPSFTELNEYTEGVAFCNEEGRFKEQSLNSKATVFWLQNLGDGPFRYPPRLLGDVVYISKTTTQRKMK
jgi:hypothetical protein